MSLAVEKWEAEDTCGTGRVPGSFRDPDGFVFQQEQTIYRQVNKSYRENWNLLMGGTYQKLVQDGLLIPHEEVSHLKPLGDDGLLIIKPEAIDFVSYPYEWCFSQLKDAALLTLEIQLAAMASGLSLKDASAYNVQFQNGRPIFIDTLSFEAYVEGRPWSGYRQFCQHFLAPLALMSRVDIGLSQLLRVHLDGIPLELASRLLPRRTWLNYGMLSHLHLHARIQRAYAKTGVGKGRDKSQVGRVRKLGLIGVLEGLRNLIEGLNWKASGTEWGAYYQETNYSDEGFASKKVLVESFLGAIAPREVWDLGANTGVFSRLASDQGIPTVAFDVDPAAVEKNYRSMRGGEPSRLLPLLLDLTNPSPGLGWGGVERDGLLSRGPTGCVMALALVHHLAISNNVPLPLVASFFRNAAEDLIVEFVPKEDSQVQRLLVGRDDFFPEYDQAGFESAFLREFEIVRREPIEGTVRTLYWMRARRCLVA